MTMTISQGYRQAQTAKHKQPCLDYPYLGIPDEDEDEIDPIWEKCREEHLKQEINNGL